MTTIDNLLVPARIQFMRRADSKKQALEQLSQLVGQQHDSVDIQELFESFVSRERLGGTGFGHGVAIPHVRSPLVEKPLGAMLYIKEGIAFDALDQAPVDILFGLLVPAKANDAHLATLAVLAKQFSDESWVHQLRMAQNTDELQAIALNHNEHNT